jgi:hypothetical protein
MNLTGLAKSFSLKCDSTYSRYERIYPPTNYSHKISFKFSNLLTRDRLSMTSQYSLPAFFEIYLFQHHVYEIFFAHKGLI